jgi:hypothetical protein
MQVSPAEHTIPQPPQLFESPSGTTQLFGLSGRGQPIDPPGIPPAGQQSPLVHRFSPIHALPQALQFAESLRTLVQTPSQIVLLVGQGEEEVLLADDVDGDLIVDDCTVDDWVVEDEVVGGQDIPA